MKGDDFEVAGEPFRILNLKGLNARLIEDTGFVGIELDYPCKFLIEKNGVYSCEIYNSKERPLLCRLYPYPDYSDCPNKKKEVGK